MVRRTVTVVAAVTFAVGGALVAAAPAQAGSAVRPVASAETPCPLTSAQIAYARQAIADARATVDRGVAALPGSSSFTWTATPSISTTSSVSTCLLALQDLQSKKYDSDAATALYIGCVLAKGTSGCTNELRDANSKLHDLEVALNNLKYACPWLAVLG